MIKVRKADSMKAAKDLNKKRKKFPLNRGDFTSEYKKRSKVENQPI